MMDAVRKAFGNDGEALRTLGIDPRRSPTTVEDEEFRRRLVERTVAAPNEPSPIHTLGGFHTHLTALLEPLGLRESGIFVDEGQARLPRTIDGGFHPSAPR